MKRTSDAILKYIREADMFLLGLCIISAVYGLILIYSAMRSLHNDTQFYIQIVSLVIGIGLYVIFSYLDVDTIADRSTILYVLSILFICTLFIWGKVVSGNRAWLRFGSIGVQPAEVVKIPYAIILAKMVSNFKEKKSLNTPLSLLQIIAMFGGLFLIILVSSKDLGSALVYLFMLIVILFVGGVDLRWLLLGFVLLAGALFLAWNYFLSPDQLERIKAPYDPNIDPKHLNVNWQVYQSKYAIAGGNFLGQGYLKGMMTQAGSVPVQSTDFIFSAAAEELGFVGGFAIILLLIMIIIRCIVVGVRSNSTIGLLVCTGLAAMLLSQTFENIGMCIGLTPVIGLTLPFFSQGGTSLVTVFAAMGIISGIKMRPKPSRYRS